MSLPKKGSRKLIVDGVSFRWKSGGTKSFSGWMEPDAETVDSRWAEQAKRFGLGKFAKITVSIFVELFDHPVSKLTAQYPGIIIDGFLGLESDIRIKPHWVRATIMEALQQGWIPQERGDFDLGIVDEMQDTKAVRKPLLLVLPEWDNSIANYENTDIPTLLWQKPENPPEGSETEDKDI